MIRLLAENRTRHTPCSQTARDPGPVLQVASYVALAADIGNTLIAQLTDVGEWERAAWSRPT